MPLGGQVRDLHMGCKSPGRRQPNGGQKTIFIPLWVSLAFWFEARRDRLSAGEVNLRMLWDMVTAYEQVPSMRSPSMDVGLLLHLFYQLEERGAAFGPYVYEILNKRKRHQALAARRTLYQSRPGECIELTLSGDPPCGSEREKGQKWFRETNVIRWMNMGCLLRMLVPGPSISSRLN